MSLHLGPTATVAVDFDAARSAITHTRYGALKVKDAIVDQLREKRGTRPDVDTTRPDVRVNVRVVADQAVFAIDLAGESLHRRGWRGAGVAAPLKENLAAALLLRCGWPTIAAAGGAFLDPMCGSGTLPIEAAAIAAERRASAGTTSASLAGPATTRGSGRRCSPRRPRAARRRPTRTRPDLRQR